MSNIQQSENVDEQNFENDTNDRNSSVIDNNSTIHVNLNDTENERATENGVNMRQNEDQTKSQERCRDGDINQRPFTDCDAFYFDPSENAIREKLSEGDEDATEKDIFSLGKEKNCKEISPAEISNADKAIREQLSFSTNGEDATVNDFSTMSTNSSSKVSSMSSISKGCPPTKLCSCNEKEMCSICFKKYTSEFIASIEPSSHPFSPELCHEKNAEVISKQMS